MRPPPVPPPTAPRPDPAWRARRPLGWTGAVALSAMVLSAALAACGDAHLGGELAFEGGPARDAGRDAGLDPGARDPTPPKAGPDGAPPDADPLDATAGDGGPEAPDAETLDAETLDAWAPDTERPDAETPDAETPDAETPDADLVDQGVPPVVCAVAGRPGVCIDVAECDGDRVPTPGHCPGLAHIQCCTARPAPGPACDPQQHAQPNLGLSEAPGTGGCPPGMVAAGAHCIDRFEAALVEVFADGTTAPWSPFHNPGNRRVRAVSLEGAVPQGYISGRQAARACAEAGKRLCTDAEWLVSCRGDADRTYPYGRDREPGACNDARAQHPAVELFPGDPNPFARLQDACLNQLADGLAPTGAHPACVTPEGAFDLMGNLHEWTADPAGTFRGGFYVDTVRNGAGCLYRTTAHNYDYWDYSTGFRCCAD